MSRPPARPDRRWRRRGVPPPPTPARPCDLPRGLSSPPLRYSPDVTRLTSSLRPLSVPCPVVLKNVRLCTEAAVTTERHSSVPCRAVAGPGSPAGLLADLFRYGGADWQLQLRRPAVAAQSTVPGGSKLVMTNQRRRQLPSRKRVRRPQNTIDSQGRQLDVPLSYFVNWPV